MKTIKIFAVAVLLLTAMTVPALAGSTLVGGFAVVYDNHALAASAGLGEDITAASLAYAVSTDDVAATGDAYVTGDIADSMAGSSADNTGEYNSAEAYGYIHGYGDAFGYTIANAWR